MQRIDVDQEHQSIIDATMTFGKTSNEFFFLQRKIITILVCD